MVRAKRLARSLGIITLVCTVLYAVPPTSILGAILLTGYLGGAMASHVRIGSPLFSHILFGFYLGLMVWGGLWLRDRNLRALMPFRTLICPHRYFTDTEPSMFETIAIIAVVLAIAIAVVLDPRGDQAGHVQRPARDQHQGAAGKDLSADQRFSSVGIVVALRKQGSGDEAQL